MALFFFCDGTAHFIFNVYSLQKSLLQTASVVLRHEEPAAGVGVLQCSTMWLTVPYVKFLWFNLTQIFFHECKMHSNLAPPAPPSPTSTDQQPGSVLTWQNSSCPLFRPFLYGLHSSRFPLPAVESTCGHRSRRKLMKIVGGTIATIESHPWVTAIFWRSKSKESVFRCGGSLISACWVLTAAHCFPDG